MKGLLVKSKDKISKAGIPQNGIGLVGIKYYRKSDPGYADSYL